MSGRRAILAALFLAVAPAGSAAQPVPATAGPVLRQGTHVPMRTVQPLSSKRAMQGQRFDLEVSEEVRVDGMLVIPKGAHGVGEVSRVVEKGMMGKPGKLEVRVMYVEVAGARIRLDGKAKDKGASGAGGVVIAAPLIGLTGAAFVKGKSAAPLIGLTGAAFVKGKSAVIPAGSAIDGIVYQDVPLARPAI